MPQPTKDLFLEAVDELVEDGVLGPEECPEEHYWHWRVRKPERLPQWLKTNYDNYGEIRWYGGGAEGWL